MKQAKIKIELLPNFFLNANGTFNKEEALKFISKLAHDCYLKEDFFKSKKEVFENKIDCFDTIKNDYSLYDHVVISFRLQNIPKILGMLLKNEYPYIVNEKLEHYTSISVNENAMITKKEEKLYNKWVKIFKMRIQKQYEGVYSETQIQKLAQENARYLVTVFMPTQMIYTTTLRRINEFACCMLNYMEGSINRSLSDFEEKFINVIKEFCTELFALNVLDPRLMTHKEQISFFGKDLKKEEEFFGESYSTFYKGSFAQLANVQKIHGLHYQMEIVKNKEYFIPPIIEEDGALVQAWLEDMQILKHVYPQGEKIWIKETGTYNAFILKCQEGLCTSVQLEMMQQTKRTLLKYKRALEKGNSVLAWDIEKYLRGARCTFPDTVCFSKCPFEEEKKLTRKV